MRFYSKSNTSKTSSIKPADELSWLIRLRWIAVLGQLLIVSLTANMIVQPFALYGLFLTIAVVACSNFILWTGRLRFSSALIGTVLVLDVAALSLLLFFSGGASNPFGFFYVLHVALAAILLSERWSWFIAALACLSYGALFFVGIEIPELSAHHSHSGGEFSLHLQGMWVAFALVAITLAFFFTRIVRSLKEKEEQLSLLKQKALRIERLAAVTSLAATAAHELNTPLATIKLSAEEMVDRLRRTEGAEIRADAELILSEVTRCGRILDGLRSAAGNSEGATPEEISVEELFKELSARMGIEKDHAITLSDRAKDIALRAPRRPLTEALSALLKNALESTAAPRITIDAARSRLTQRIVIEDNGCGISLESLKKIGEPFYSTKPKGQGMGLGVFLARSFAEALGGELQILSTEGKGTKAILEFSCEC